ncbi:MAG: class I adenylate-forming enzyme family protein [Thermomicrobiales bacterium]
MQTILETIAIWAERTPDAAALLALDFPPLSYGALHGQMLTGMQRLRDLGIRQEDRIAVLLGDDLDDTVTLLTTMSAATAAPLSPSLTTAELSRDLRRLDARALVVGTGGDSGAVACARDLGLPIIPQRWLCVTPVGLAKGSDTITNADDPTPDDVMLIAHTSGTTSVPKRVPITHRMQFAAAEARNRLRGITHTDRCLLLAPGSTVMFLTNFVTMLVAGGSTVRVPHLDPLAALRANAELQPTWILATPPVYHGMLLALPSRPEFFWNPRLRLVNWGGAGADAGLVSQLERAFGAPCDSNYGMSEASAIAAPGAPGTARPGSVGVAAAGEIRVVGDAGQVLSAGETGEIVVRGPHVFGGYLDDPAATAAAFDDAGRFRTGDLGYLDSNGHLFLTGRANDRVNRGGMKIAPAEIEQVLLAQPALAEAVAFAVPDVHWGEDIVAAVALKPGKTVTARSLRSWLLDHLAPSKVPHRIWFLDEFPRTDTGKVQRHELARLWQEAHG